MPRWALASAAVVAAATLESDVEGAAWLPLPSAGAVLEVLGPLLTANRWSRGCACPLPPTRLLTRMSPVAPRLPAGWGPKPLETAVDPNNHHKSSSPLQRCSRALPPGPLSLDCVQPPVGGWHEGAVRQGRAWRLSAFRCAQLRSASRQHTHAGSCSASTPPGTLSTGNHHLDRRSCAVPAAREAAGSD